MIVTRNWLQEFVPFDLSPEDLAHRLTMVGLEVDAMEKIGGGLDSVVVARLKSVEAHPDADRLTLCLGDDGQESVQVVCGAKNHRAGDLVALAKVGTQLPGGLKIKKSKIRGQISMGMLCSEPELGLSEESDGIMILPGNLPLGKPVFEVLGLRDVRYELGLTPNRPDCLSVLGVAREVAAFVGESLHHREPTLVEAGPDIGELTSVVIEDTTRCPRYAARLIQGVRIGPSPDWLRRRLEAVGQRSINNVVDVTNYVLMELGHPLHAFDFNLLRGGKIIVKTAEKGSVFQTLDGQERILAESDLTICDEVGPVALAGIMGGQNSEIQEDTKDILLESAYFQPTAIRRTSKRLGMHTESSHRFERGADVDIVPVALDRAAELILNVAGGKLAAGRFDVFPSQIPKRQIAVSPVQIRQILGVDIDADDIIHLLYSIGLPARLTDSQGEQGLEVTAPSFRPDIEREVDVIEEVARLYGYDHIPPSMPVGRSICRPSMPRQRRIRAIRENLVNNGFSEVLDYSFVAPHSMDRILLPADDVRRHTIKILNPLSEEQSVMRTTLVPSLLGTAQRNFAYRLRDLALFELRPTFLPRPGKELPEEELRLAALLAGRREPVGWAQIERDVDFFDIKGFVEEVLERLRIKGITWDSSLTEPFYHPGKSCTLKMNDVPVGTLGEIHPLVVKEFDLEPPVLVCDLNLQALLEHAQDHPGFRQLSKFPDTFRDTAVLVTEDVSAETFLRILEKSRGGDVEEILLFDLYRGKGVVEGKKSLAFRARYRSQERTLTDDEINAQHGRMVQALIDQLEAEIR